MYLRLIKCKFLIYWKKLIFQTIKKIFIRLKIKIKKKSNYIFTTNKNEKILNPTNKTFTLVTNISIDLNLELIKQLEIILKLAVVIQTKQSNARQTVIELGPIGQIYSNPVILRRLLRNRVYRHGTEALIIVIIGGRVMRRG